MADGELYFQDWAEKNSRLLRAKLPGPVIEQMPAKTGILLSVGGRVHAIESVWMQARNDPSPERARWRCNWWVLEPGDKRPRLVGSDMSIIRGVGVSSHYGLVALVQSDDPEPKTGFYTVEVAGPGKK